jgi:ElaB/YqjD/DUF883 family membrane-anchored ribosome-binding protein
MEAAMTTAKGKDTFGYLGTERAALREELERLANSIEQAAKSEGADAVRAAADTARRLAQRLGEGQAELEEAIRQKPLAAVALAGAAGFLLALLVRR